MCTMGWLSGGHQRKLPQSLLMFAMFAAKHFHYLKTNIIFYQDMIHPSDYTLTLDVIGRDTLGDRLPKAVCGSCRTFWWCYGRGKADVERIGTFVRKKTSTRLRARESNNRMLLWASIFNVLKSSLHVTKRFTLYLVCFSTEEKMGEHYFQEGVSFSKM